MGRKKNEDRPIELQTSPINLRVTNEARKIIDNISKYDRGKWLSERISSKLYTRQELNAYASEKVKEALMQAYATAEPYSEIVADSILSLETELLNQIDKEI